jgi:hypothetical protein
MSLRKIPRTLLVFAVCAILGLGGGLAVADYTVKDAGSTTRTIFAFVCVTTKICPAHVTIKSDGTEVGTSSAELFVGGRGTAGAAAGGVVTVQGVASMTPLLSTVNSWASGTLGAMANYGTSPGAVLVPSVNAYVTNATQGRTTPALSSPVVLPASKYIAVAASQTATTLVGAGSGATGDYLSHCVIYPASTSPGVVTVFDNTNTAANSAILFAGGASSTSNLTPVAIPVGALSVNGAWKVTTGANVSVVCYGNFT